MIYYEKKSSLLETKWKQKLTHIDKLDRRVNAYSASQWRRFEVFTPSAVSMLARLIPLLIKEP